MDKERIEALVDEVAVVLEAWDDKDHPRDDDGKFATSGVARHAPGKGMGSLQDRLKRRVAVGGPEHDDDSAHHDAYAKAPARIKSKGGTTMYKAGWDNVKKKPVYVTVPGRDESACGVAGMVLDAADEVIEAWSEGDHPRDGDGKFSSGGDSSKSEKKRKTKEFNRRISTYEFNGFTFKKPSDEELERNKSMPRPRVSGRR